MRKNQDSQTKSVFRRKREALSLSREKAGELLDGMQPERIERTESGKLPARPEEVLIMAKGYKAPELCNHYRAHECAIGKECVTEVTLEDLSRITLRMLSSINTLESNQRRLIEIAADGEIGEDEIEDFVDMQMELEQLPVAIEMLQLWTEQMIVDGRINSDKHEKIKASKTTKR